MITVTTTADAAVITTTKYREKKRVVKTDIMR